MVSAQSNKNNSTTTDGLDQLSQMSAKALDLLCGGFLDDAEELLILCLVSGIRRVKEGNTLEMPESEPFLVDLPLQDAVFPEDFITDHESNFCLYPIIFGARENGIRDSRTFVSLAAFNLAMLYHETGLLDANLSNLAKARSLYKISLNYLPKTSYEATWLSLAALNILGHVSSFFRDTETMQVCHGAMSDCLQFLPSTSWVWFRNSLAAARPSPTTFAPVA